MKKILIGALLTLIVGVSNIYAKTDTKSQGYVAYNEMYQEVMDTPYLDVESMNATVGGSGHRKEIEIGFANNNTNKRHGKIQTQVFLYSSVNEQKNNEKIFGLGGRGSLCKYFEGNLCFGVGAKGGTGSQKVKGSTFTSKSNVSNIPYIVGGYSLTPLLATYTSNTYVVEIVLMFYTKLKLHDNIYVKLDANYHSSFYQFAYKLENGGRVDMAGTGQDSYSTSLGLELWF